MSLITDETRASATEVLSRDEICRERLKSLLIEMGLPNGLLPLDDIEEFCYVKDTDFVWIKQKKEKVHKIDQIDKLVSYETEVTGFMGRFKIERLTGVKIKELLIWITLNEITIDDPLTGNITFGSPSGLYRTFPALAYGM
ncbi:hypothetical protein L6452_02959 [Arctium lappa]|uniref:Uncharacterized protein n=1 Tax=Arctium lappa TaxID=4217 RepID=A0ACB9FM42_ARCLA|nr:hypothetical protein L6452_02959 [Arctium lappa]